MMHHIYSMQQTLRNRRYLRHRKIYNIKVFITCLFNDSNFFLLESSSSLFDTRPTSNVIRVHNARQLFVCPPTPCMFGYRQKSLPTLVPTRIIKYPKTFDDSLKQFDIDHLDI